MDKFSRVRNSGAAEGAHNATEIIYQPGKTHLTIEKYYPPVFDRLVQVLSARDLSRSCHEARGILFIVPVLDENFAGAIPRERG